MLYETSNRHNCQSYVQNRQIEKDRAYVGIRESAGKEGHFRPDTFVFKVAVPTLMDMEGCMASTGYPAHHSGDVFMNDAFFSGTTSLATKE